VSEGTCCDDCNSTKVLPARLRRVGAYELAQAFERGLVTEPKKGQS